MSDPEPVFSKRQIRVCKSKRAFACKADARNAAARSRKRSGLRIYFYRCKVCGSWHLTKANPNYVRWARREQVKMDIME